MNGEISNPIRRVGVAKRKMNADERTMYVAAPDLAMCVLLVTCQSVTSLRLIMLHACCWSLVSQ